MTLAYFDANQVAQIASAPVAVSALENALAAGHADPELDSPRLFSPAPRGEFLLMPTSFGDYAGVKVVTIAPENPAAGFPKIQGTYLLFDAATLSPIASMDGAELTLIRTPATTVMAIKHLLLADPRGARTDSGTLVVFGAGPQAWRHIESLNQIAPPNRVIVVGRRPERVEELLNKCAAAGISASAGVAADASQADVIICSTSSATPVLNGADVPDNAVVAAIGSHGLEARELPADLILRSDIVVESRAGAMREAGNLIPARSREEWMARELPNLAEVVRGEVTRTEGKPAVYSGVGMAWQDIVVAARIYTEATAS